MAHDKTLEMFLFVCKKPMMYVQEARFSAIVGYIDGYDTALQGGPLLGFRGWLLIGSKEWTNLPWWSLVRLRRDPGADLSRPPTDEEDQALIGELHNALDDFSVALKQGGLGSVFPIVTTLGCSAEPTQPQRNLRDRLRRE